VVGHYDNFFIAARARPQPSWGCWLSPYRSSAPTTGTPLTRQNRTVLAGSAFVALVDIFLVSTVALTGGHFSRGFRTRKLNIAFALISVGTCSVQLGPAIALLTDTRSTALQHALVLVIVALYCSALGRAWEVTGITRRGRGRLDPLGVLSGRVRRSGPW
jgi:hypothetical protein